MENAILMASGLGTRMRPITESIPKPLVEVGGKPMVETVIEGLLSRETLGKIYVVAGYLAEQFLYLEKKYNKVKLIYNSDYETVNNISSIYAARNVLREGACFICEADLVVRDPQIFAARYLESGYFGKWVDGKTEDWVFDLGQDDFISRVGKIGENCYEMVGISFFLEKDARILANAIECRYGTEGYERLFWDDVVNENLDKIKLRIYPVRENQIIEIDTVEELLEVRRGLEKNYDKASKGK